MSHKSIGAWCFWDYGASKEKSWSFSWATAAAAAETETHETIYIGLKLCYFKRDIIIELYIIYFIAHSCTSFDK